MKTLPGHLLGPTQHRVHIDQLRAIPLPLQDTPASFDRMIFAMVRWIIQELNRLVDHVSELHHTREKLGPSATTFWTIGHFDLDQTRLCLLLLRHGLPLGVDHIHDEITRFIGAAKGQGQLATLFIDDPTRDLFLLASHIGITGSISATGAPATGELADLHRRFTIDTPAFDACR